MNISRKVGCESRSVIAIRILSVAPAGNDRESDHDGHDVVLRNMAGGASKERLFETMRTFVDRRVSTRSSPGSRTTAGLCRAESARVVRCRFSSRTRSAALNFAIGLLGLVRLTLGVVGAPLSLLCPCFGLLQLLFGLLPFAGEQIGHK